MQAGQLRDRVTFALRSSGTDEFGNGEGDFADQFTVWARVQYLRGGEDVMAARLQGNQPVVITVRASTDTRRITTDWRATDERDATRVFNVRSASPGERRDSIDLLCQSGVPV